MIEVLRDLMNIKRGKAVTYHRGFLANDRAKREVALIAEEAYKLYLSGKVILIQVRLTPPLYQNEVNFKHGVGTFEYIAISI